MVSPLTVPVLQSHYTTIEYDAYEKVWTSEESQL